MKIAYYATMKPPDHRVPSGDREIARILFEACQDMKHHVFLASRIGTWQRKPDSNLLREKKMEISKEAVRLRNEIQNAGSKPDMWITYHNYHKAPDLLGPVMAREFGIPYVIIEASRAAKRKFDGWADGLEAADKALKSADLVVSLNTRDEIGISEIVPEKKRGRLRPFIEDFRFTQSNREEFNPIRLLTVAMMRPGDKHKSYQILAHSLSSLQDIPWRMTIVGDGPMRRDIEVLFQFDNCEFVGEVSPSKIMDYYSQADLYLWPAINETFGMTLIEAQASSLAVIAGRSSGVPEVVVHGGSGLLVESNNVKAFSDAVRKVLTDHKLRVRLRAGAIENATTNHGYSQGVESLKLLLQTARSNFELENQNKLATKCGP